MAKIKSVPAVVLNNFRNKYIANEICRGVNVYVHEDPNRTEAIQSAARMWLKLNTMGRLRMSAIPESMQTMRQINEK